MDRSAFGRVDVATEEIDQDEKVVGALADAVRDLNTAVIQTRIDHDEVREITALVEDLTRRLAKDRVDGQAGVNFNGLGRSWNWGNAAVGIRNAVAPPMRLVFDEPVGDRPRVVWAELDLGPAYEGPPTLVHGGVSALLLDHLMGETASWSGPNGTRRPTFTGTLTLRYEQPLPLGRVRIEGHITDNGPVKVRVAATIRSLEMDAPSLVADGIFVVPRWAREGA